MGDPLNVLLCWESIETNSWNPVLADLLRHEGLMVTEVHDLDARQVTRPLGFLG